MNKNKHSKDAQGWIHDYSEKHGFSIDFDKQEDHVVEQFEEIKPFWLAVSIIGCGLLLAVIVVTGI